MTEFTGQPEIAEVEKRPTVEQLIAWGEKALRGEMQGDLSKYHEASASEEQHDYPEGDFDLDDGVILDENSELYTEDEKEKLRTWLGEKLGSSVDTASVKRSFISPDEMGGFDVFDKDFGDDEMTWYITRWQNEGEKPSYVIWSEDMVSMQEEMGYSGNSQYEEES